MRAAASVRAVVHDALASNPDSPERRPATPVDAGRRTRECAIRRKALPRKSAGDFSARKIAGKNARAPTCVFCTVCDVMVAESRVSLVRLFASSCSKNRERGPTFDLASTVCSQVLSRHRSRKARRLVRRRPPRRETRAANRHPSRASRATARRARPYGRSSWCARREMARAA